MLHRTFFVLRNKSFCERRYELNNEKIAPGSSQNLNWNRHRFPAALRGHPVKRINSVPGAFLSARRKQAGAPIMSNNIARTAVLVLAALSVTAAGPTSAQTFE